MSLHVSMPSILPVIMIVANLLVVAISYLLGWMRVGLVASLFYSVMMWVGSQTYELWGYTEWVAYPMYGVMILMAFFFLAFRRRFEKKEPVALIQRLIRPKEKNSVWFVLGDEKIDSEK